MLALWIAKFFISIFSSQLKRQQKWQRQQNWCWQSTSITTSDEAKIKAEFFLPLLVLRISTNFTSEQGLVARSEWIEVDSWWAAAACLASLHSNPLHCLLQCILHFNMKFLHCEHPTTTHFATCSSVVCTVIYCVCTVILY